jgi:hypothetical protein
MTMQMVTDFLLSNWLWSMTWGWYHIPVNFLLLYFLLKWLMRASMIPALWMSLGAQFFTFMISTGLGGFILCWLNLSFEPVLQPLTMGYELLAACLRFGISCAVLQILFFVLLNLWYKINIRLAICAALLSNILTALLLSKILPLMVL